jgi:exodeoxyribonuclease V alpha subunit
VIIANLLYDRKIPFEYELNLRMAGKEYWPDFTITWKGQTFYWEHLGRLDLEAYRAKWKRKKTLYETHFAGQVITTEESPFLSRDTAANIDNYFLG